MRLIRGLHNLRSEPLLASVATIGNYDGVHRGHQAVLTSLVEEGRLRKLPVVVVVFEPTPAEFFAAEKAPSRLNRLVDKLPVLALCGVDYVVCLRFNEALAQTEPEAFAQKLLADSLGVKHLVIGDDFRFGKDRSGDYALLEKVGAASGFTVASHPTVAMADERISSTRIRELLTAGECGQAAALLGQPFRVSGRVAHGDKLGRQLSFPTANIPLRRVRSPVNGVFVVTVEGLVENGVRLEPHRAIANVGHRPTVNGIGDRLEVHLLDFSGDLYGQRLTVSFLAKLREEQKFESVDALKAQISADVEQARSWFINHDPRSD